MIQMPGIKNTINGRDPQLAGENLDHYFFQLMQGITPHQLESLPPRLRTIARRGAEAATRQFTIEQKRKIMVETFGLYAAEIWYDPQGMSVQDFMTIFTNQKKQGKSKETADLLHDNRVFVLGNKLFVRSMEYLEMICAGDIYKLADRYRSDIKVDGGRSKKIRDTMDALKFIVRLLTSYERAASNFCKNYGLQKADLYLLFYLFGEPQTKGRQPFYDMFQGAVGANHVAMKLSFTRMKQAGYIQPKNEGESPAYYYITSRGESVLLNFLKSVMIGF